MIAALLTTSFFAFSIIFAQRSLTQAGQLQANIGRLIVAALALGTISRKNSNKKRHHRCFRVNSQVARHYW